MPEYVLNRNYTLVSLSGRVINFRKGEPVWAIPEAEKEALGIGATPVDGKKDILDPEVPAELPLDAADRQLLINEAYDVMKARDVRGDFTAQGVPNLGVLSKIVGFEVASKERDATWQAYKEAAIERAAQE